MPELTDHRGQNLEKQNLTEEIAVQSLANVRTIWHDSVANTLTPERLGEVLQAVDQNGDIYEYLTLAEEMEERDLHYHSVLSTRRLTVSSLEIAVESVADDAANTKIADFVREVLTDEDTIRPRLADQLDALGKGYSVNEIMWDRSERYWRPDKYIWRDPRFFQFDRTTGDILRLRDKEDMINGIPLAAYKFVVHTPQIKAGLQVRSGLARLAAVAFMCKGYSMKDWMAFAEVYGMPLRVGKYGAGASPAQKAELLRAVSNIGTDAAAIIPESMVIDFMDGARSGGGVGEAVFERLANWLDRQVSKGVLGQTMTTDDGSSLSQAKVHNEVRSDIRDNDAMQLAATLRRDLVKPLVDLNFGQRKRNEYPVVRLVAEEPEDLKLLSESLPPFIELGLPVEASVILDKFGLPMPDEGAQLLGDVKPEGDEEPPAPEPAAARAMFTDANGAIYQVLVAKVHFDLDAAKRWLKDHGFKTAQSGTTDEYWVFPQRPESDFTDMPLWQAAQTRGVISVIGQLKPALNRSEVHAELMRRVVAGVTLTDDQRTLLATFQEAKPQFDQIDHLVNEELEGWRQVMNPMLAPIMKLAEESDDYDSFIAGIDKLSKQTDVEPFVQSLAVAMLKARGLGDGTDEP